MYKLLDNPDSPNEESHEPSELRSEFSHNFKAALIDFLIT